MTCTIRPLTASDAPRLAEAFARAGWVKPTSTFERYAEEQASGERLCWLAELDATIAGYVTLVWSPSYPALRDRGLPEIQDLNVLPPYRRRGVARQLVERAEAEAATRVDEVGIGVGLHSGYAAAQRMYVLRGYVPDGLGVSYRDEPAEEGQSLPLDDDLVLHLTKRLSRRSSRRAT